MSRKLRGGERSAEGGNEALGGGKRSYAQLLYASIANAGLLVAGNCSVLCNGAALVPHW